MIVWIMTPNTEAIPVWIEDCEGTIVRGTAEALSPGGARVRLQGPARFEEGAGVALRIRVDPHMPIVAGSARVSWIRSDDGPPSCGLEWTQVEAALEQWLTTTDE